MPDSLDTQSFDKDADQGLGDFFDAEDEDENEESDETSSLRTEDDFRQRAAEVYALYARSLQEAISLAVATPLRHRPR